MAITVPPIGGSIEVDQDTKDAVTFLTSISADFARKSLSNSFTATNDFYAPTIFHAPIQALSGAVFVNKEQVLVEDNFITVNYGEVGSGVTNISAGIKVDRGTQEPYYFLFDENSDSFKIGNEDSLQKVATREDSPLDSGIAIWNNNDVRFDTNYTVEQWTTVPLSGSASGLKGQLAYDSGYVYMCIANDQWVRVSVETSW